MITFTLLSQLLLATSVKALPPQQLPLARRSCYQASLQLWQGSTQEMVEGNEKYASCLEKLAVQTLEQHYTPEVLEGQKPAVFLNHLLKQVDQLSWGVYTQPRSCAPDCGTMWSLGGSAGRGKFLEHLLQDMAERLLLESEKADQIDDRRWKDCWLNPEKCDLKWFQQTLK